MNPADLASALLSVVQGAVERRDAGQAASLTVDDIALERPRNRDHGDWATSVALKWAKRLGMPPRAFAEELEPGILAIEGVAAVEIAGPGFLNIRLEAGAAGASSWMGPAPLVNAVFFRGGDLGPKSASVVA